MTDRPRSANLAVHPDLRALVIVLDSVGVGAAPDAAAYGDSGCATLPHILERTGIELPNLWAMGLGQVLGVRPVARPIASYGRLRPCAVGKDSTTGHWELMGAVLEEPFLVYERFPAALVHAIERACGVRFIGNKAASGTGILDELGAEHVRTGALILYTSGDSVLQIAAHEDVVPVERLYEVCRVARSLADAYRIGRVIARPFIGAAGAWVRTAHRHDFSMDPPRTVLDGLREAGVPTRSIGKVWDLFNGRGLTEGSPTGSNQEGMERTLDRWLNKAAGLVFTNLVDFDTLYGHRRDVYGYARALVEFDAWLKQLLPHCSREGDLVIVTADHGNDPTFRGTDHTREEVPVLMLGGAGAQPLGVRGSFADVGATLAAWFGVAGVGRGESMLGVGTALRMSAA